MSKVKKRKKKAGKSTGMKRQGSLKRKKTGGKMKNKIKLAYEVDSRSTRDISEKK